MNETASLHPTENSSSLRAEAPSFTSGQAKEHRPTNLRHLRTNPQPGRGLDAALDYIPFTPSQGIITPSPLAAAHYDQQMLMYPFTPQGPPPAGGFDEGLPGLHSISEEGSSNSGQSYTTFSPFRWPMPVSPSAFPVHQEAYMVPSQGVTQSSGLAAGPSMVPLGTHEYMYPVNLPPGSPVYVRTPSVLAHSQPWSNHRRAHSRLSGMQASGAMYLTVPAPGSPVYPPGMTPMDFSQALSMGMMYSYGGRSPASSPRWQPPASMHYPIQGPPTPPRNSRFGIPQQTPFRSFVPSMAPHAEPPRAEKKGDAVSEQPNPAGLGGSFLQTGHQTDGSVPMNARQRRTARRKAEREAKARAEEKARQEAAALAGKDEGEVPPPEHSDDESTLTVTGQRPEDTAATNKLPN